jgi:glycosyltransferase involved in cell wall biosynthesis
VVTDGKDGFLVRTPDEFAERVALLASDVELRKRMALAARRTVEERFSLQAAAERLLRILALK